MAIHKNDIDELRRLATNLYDGDKACMKRIINGIFDYEQTIRTLQAQIVKLQEQLPKG